MHYSHWINAPINLPYNTLIKTFIEARYIEVPLNSSQVKSALFRQSGPISHWLVSKGVLRTVTTTR